MSKITYRNSLHNVTPEMLNGGFFAGWANPPISQKHMQILLNSAYVVLAVENDEKVIGFINAISDGILSAYIPLLEVLPEYKNRGIGHQLVSRMLEMLKDFYMVDLCCENHWRAFIMSLE